MNTDDILFAPVGMAEDDKEFIWEIMVSALGTTFDEANMAELKQQLFHELNEAGRIEILNKSDIRASLNT